MVWGFTFGIVGVWRLPCFTFWRQDASAAPHLPCAPSPLLLSAHVAGAQGHEDRPMLIRLLSVASTGFAASKL